MSAKKRYLAMFKPEWLEEKSIKEMVEKSIDDARRVLKKDDKIVWFLRLVKHVTLSKIQTESNYKLSKKDSAWMRKFEEEFLEEGDVTVNKKGIREISITPDMMMQEFTHYVDMNMPEMDSFEFKKKPFDVLLRQLQDMEVKFSAEMEAERKRSVKEYGSLLIDLGNDMAWFDLEKPGCPIEGEAMAHCGNGYGARLQNVYSLRTRDPRKPGNWIPHVTAIMNNTEAGFIGEIKGYANEKPAEKYHDALVEFILHDEVTRLEGGGYKPENNFMISDLSHERKERVLEEKPELFNSYELWEINKEEVDDRTMRSLLNEIGFEHDKEKSLDELSKESFIIIGEYDCIGEMAEDLNLDDLKRYYEATNDQDGFFFSDGGGDLEVFQSEIRGELESYLRDPENASIKEALIKYIKEKEPDYIEDNEVDLEDYSDLFYAMLENNELKLVLESSAQRAVEDGVLIKISESIGNQIDSMSNEGVEVIRNDSDEKVSIAISPIELFRKAKILNQHNDFEMEDIFNTVKDNISDNEVFAFDDIKVPYNGFDGFCTESVKDELNYRLGEELHEYIVRPGEPVASAENNTVFPEPSDQAIRKKEMEIRAQGTGLSM